jgi:serine phosphatase RsbU (regulator of sigma subunit)
MSEDALKSRAFQNAALKSESYRLVGILCLLGAMLLFVIAQGAAAEHYILLVAQVLILALVITHEAFMLRAVRTALRDEKEVAPEKWVLNVLIESQIPTVALFLLMAVPWLTPYQVLVAPAVLLYFILIILSTLRLKPILALLTGILSAAGYLLITFYTGMKFPSSGLQTGEFPLGVYFIYAGAIFTAGVIAAFVASQIRVHVKAALREAELQNELAQVNHDLGIAKSIQQGLLPSQAPSLKDFDLAGWNEPANQTGGDYFDWQSLPDGRLAISLGDATGHGIGPALISTSCRAYARASFVGDAAHDHLLERLNRLLADDLSANRFVTFAVVFLDLKDSAVEVLSAGHGPILWYQYDTDKFESLEAQGIPLGMIAGVSYEKAEARRQLAPGDMIVLVTDGFYEWENPEGEEFGVERLEKTIRQARDCSAAEVIARLRSSVENFCKGTEQKDDLTAIVLKRKPVMSEMRT